MVEMDLEALTYEEIKEPERRLLQDEDIEVKKIKHLGLIKTRVAKVVYPDVIYCKKEEFIETDALPNKVRQHEYFKDFSYHIIKFNFGIVPNDWTEIEHTGILLKIEHIDEPKITIHTPAVFPTENAVEIGKVVKDYQVTKSFSVKVPDIDIPTLGFKLPLSAGANLSSQTLKKIEYGLKIPKVTTAFSGNNDAWWKFYQNEALGPQGQYRTDMIVGLPMKKSRRYVVKMTLTTNIKRAFGASQIDNTIPIEFKSSL